MVKENRQQQGRDEDPKRNAGRKGPKEQRAESPSVPGKSLREDTGCELEERLVC